MSKYVGGRLMFKKRKKGGQRDETPPRVTGNALRPRVTGKAFRPLIAPAKRS